MHYQSPEPPCHIYVYSRFSQASPENPADLRMCIYIPSTLYPYPYLFLSIDGGTPQNPQSSPRSKIGCISFPPFHIIVCLHGSGPQRASGASSDQSTVASFPEIFPSLTPSTSSPPPPPPDHISRTPGLHWKCKSCSGWSSGGWCGRSM